MYKSFLIIAFLLSVSTLCDARASKVYECPSESYVVSMLPQIIGDKKIKYDDLDLAPQITIGFAEVPVEVSLYQTKSKGMYHLGCSYKFGELEISLSGSLKHRSCAIPGGERNIQSNETTKTCKNSSDCKIECK